MRRCSKGFNIVEALEFNQLFAGLFANEAEQGRDFFAAQQQDSRRCSSLTPTVPAISKKGWVEADELAQAEDE